MSVDINSCMPVLQ